MIRCSGSVRIGPAQGQTMSHVLRAVRCGRRLICVLGCGGRLHCRVRISNGGQSRYLAQNNTYKNLTAASAAI